MPASEDSHVGKVMWGRDRALHLMATGALDRDSVSTLAGRLGIGDRHLQQLFHQHLGTFPIVPATKATLTDRSQQWRPDRDISRSSSCLTVS